MRSQVLEATIQLLVEQGPEGLRVEDVAAESGVHKTTIYRRWPTRHDLVLDAIGEYTSQAIPMPDTGSAREDFIQIILSLATLLQSNPGKAVVRAAQSADPAAREVAETGRDIWRTRLRAAEEVVRRAIERGDLPTTDTELLYETLCGPVHLRSLIGDRRFTRRDAERHVDLVIAGLKAVASTPMPRPRRPR